MVGIASVGAKMRNQFRYRKWAWVLVAHIGVLVDAAYAAWVHSATVLMALHVAAGIADLSAEVALIAPALFSSHAGLRTFVSAKFMLSCIRDPGTCSIRVAFAA
jgi:hypothetical protein